LIKISGKPFSSTIRSRLNNQVIEINWQTPGQFTQAPSISSIFLLCYSIKSWLDLRDDHVAVVHCANGRSRTGVLIACLLKYIGAFENATDAFEFFCNAR
jgi:protein tyrosine phosphatase